MKNTIKKYLGQHVLIDYYRCNQIIKDCLALEKKLKQSIQECGGTVVTSTFHAFSPYGVSGVVVIAESHVAVHTWPEYQAACIDIFSCGPNLNLEKLVEDIGVIFQAQHYEMHYKKRGDKLLEMGGKLMLCDKLEISDKFIEQIVR